MPTRTLSIMIADLVGSTAKATSVDAIRGAEYLEDATSPIKKTIEGQGGRVIKFTGDGFIAVFENARDSLFCADAIRDHYIRQQYAPGGFVIDGVRVVVHTGDVAVEDDDLIGDAVIVPSRLEKSVPTNQVWVTAATKEVVGISDFVFQHVGDVQLRGRPLPISVYSLENTDLSYIEHGSVLMVTDLHYYRTVSERLAPIALNQWLSDWANLHREAVRGLKGHIRQFVSDMALVTFTNADDAVQAAINLQRLAIESNQDREDMPKYHFKAAIATGDIILSSNGIVGKLVNETFDLLGATPRDSVCLDTATFNQLQSKKVHTEGIELAIGREDKVSALCYRLKPLSARNSQV
jgi:class 3 adenylate cyclase